jgi:hypothetical protein
MRKIAGVKRELQYTRTFRKLRTKERTIDMENRKHAGNYKGTAHMKAENQDMAFVNDVVEKKQSEQTVRGEKSGKSK